MILDDELNRVFSTQNGLNKKNSAAQLSDNVINRNDFYKKLFTSVSSKIFEENSNEKKYFRNSFINESLFKKYKISNQLDFLYKNNNSIFKIFNDEEFIEYFIRENNGILEGEVALQDADINVFGEKINNEIQIQPDTSQDGSKLDPVIILNALSRILFFLFCIYVSNLDEFNDFQEVVEFYINSIECKGVTTSSVNLRSAPNITSELILTIPKDSGLKIYNESHNGWVKVKVNLNGLEFEGYVSEDFIRRID